MKTVVRAWLVLCFLSVSGCTGWIRIPEGSRTVPKYRQYEVWSHDSRVLLHAVMFDPDSIRGIPAADPLQCDSCAVAFAVADVDSVRTGVVSSGNSLLAATAGVLVGSILTLGILLGDMSD